ncbi:MAG: rod shape-determining protein MreC [Synergistales bacterium]|nr:rod shape-determining protein MreC [Synergistales bacterium]MDY6402205.1 rod shape-determining protein MreC [Synergistales bacterium]MDY6404153.1 rod shape-determining protein MreC [Synergistales bacterium]MDY6409773.1 rod shape-determining protein MreC [Synergistales bacterium]MDY6414190.1 rod shape-determining protein MreC [Synergistales bacterium]
MDNTGNITRERIHGITALILALFLLGVSSGLGVVKNIVDIWGTLLIIPEYPAVLMRDAFLRWRSWSQDKNSLNEEVIKLREENARLRLDLAKLTGEKIYSDDAHNNLRTARVTLRAPMSWWNEIRIDKGEADKITQGLVMFSNGYLLGRVSSVAIMSSWVELITSSSFMIPAVIEETRELGVITGDGSGNVLLRYIPAGRGIKAGMNVSTAMIGEQLPPGLPIGKIVSEISSASGYATYKIEPGADMSKFYTVNY